MFPQEPANQHQHRAGIKDQPGREDQDRQNEHRDSHATLTLSRAVAARKPPIPRAPSAATAG
jgi:hypothetical protein